MVPVGRIGLALGCGEARAGAQQREGGGEVGRGDGGEGEQGEGAGEEGFEAVGLGAGEVAGQAVGAFGEDVLVRWRGCRAVVFGLGG